MAEHSGGRAARLACVEGCVALVALCVGCRSGELPLREPTVPVEQQPAQVSGVVAAQQQFEWLPYEKASFDRAKAEDRYVLLHGSAAWCHWCHVMEDTTYRDPAVARLIKERFIAIKVDVDARPDIEERYGEWGWPATILFNPQGEEIGKFRGYIATKELVPILEGIEDQKLEGADSLAHTEPGADSAPVAALPWIMTRTLRDLLWFWDPELGGWGTRQKAPLGDNAEVDLRRGARGDEDALERAKFALEKQALLMDPIWGGIYQYSTGSSWGSPHYEKLMTFQAMNLEAYAAAYPVFREAFFLDQAKAIESYVERFLTSKDGTFYANQDADVGAHDPKQKFVAGRDYYSKSEADRLALGVPWVDEHIYAYENGLMIAALVSLHEATSVEASTQALIKARRALDRVLKTHVSDGNVKHDAEDESSVRYLVDAAGLGRAACRVAEVTKNEEYRAAAVRIGEALDESFLDPKTGAYFAHTDDPDAWGVFAERRQPFRHNVLAARFLSCLGRLTGQKSYEEAARRTLAAIATPAALDAQGRMLGSFLLALDEAGIRLPGVEEGVTSEERVEPEAPAPRPAARPAQPKPTPLRAPPGGPGSEPLVDDPPADGSAGPTQNQGDDLDRGETHGTGD